MILIKLRRVGATLQQVTCTMSLENRHFVCEVILPENSLLHSATGRSASSKSTTKRSAAFEALSYALAEEVPGQPSVADLSQSTSTEPHNSHVLDSPSTWQGGYTIGNPGTCGINSGRRLRVTWEEIEWGDCSE